MRRLVGRERLIEDSSGLVPWQQGRQMDHRAVSTGGMGGISSREMDGPRIGGHTEGSDGQYKGRGDTAATVVVAESQGW